jgi:hypothetical protein
MKHTPKILNSEGIRQWNLIEKDFITEIEFFDSSTLFDFE